MHPRVLGDQVVLSAVQCMLHVVCVCVFVCVRARMCIGARADRCKIKLLIRVYCFRLFFSRHDANHWDWAP